MTAPGLLHGRRRYPDQPDPPRGAGRYPSQITSEMLESIQRDGEVTMQGQITIEMNLEDYTELIGDLLGGKALIREGDQ